MSELWPEVEKVFEAVLTSPPPEREGTLARMCAGDAELLREVRSLLAAHAESEGFLATSAESFARPFLIEAAANESRDQPGQTVGRYRLLRQIGRGGMGAVWLAERSDGHFEHRVALKLIKRGMDSEEILARFLRERQILARLEHPNIARLLDGGVNDDGRPYFVMEYVEGSAITRFSDERKLAQEPRLRLFVQACRAIGYAHRNLVVHRDIKPSNVMVDAAGELKLLDFGIARVLGDTDPTAQLTGPARQLMTPEYASPEQRAGLRVTTSSDVYQLGLLLYELLTGHHFSTGDRRLRGDLDTVTQRALRDEPERRYPSAEDLADDVERHLAHKPLRFGGDRAAYRARKFIRRHRFAVGTAVTIVTLTFGLLGFDAVRVRQERDRARHEADKAIEVSQLMARFLQGWNPDASDRGAVSAPKLLGEAAVRARLELQNRPEMLGATLSILGDFHTTLGEWSRADSLLSEALALQSTAVDRSGADLAATVARRGRLLRLSGRLDEAIVTMREALALHRTHFGPRHAETLRVERELANAYRAAKHYKEAETELRDILRAVGAGSPFGLEVSGDLGYVLFQQGLFDEAVELLRPTLQRQRELFGNVHLATLTTTRQLGSALRDRGDLDEALGLYREALRIARALYGEDHPETESSLLVLALVLEYKNELPEAEALAREALAVNTRVYGPGHSSQWGHLSHVGALRLDRNDPQEAERWLRQALVASRVAAPNGDADQGDILNRLAYLLVLRNAPDADVVYREAVRFDDARPADLPDFVSDGIHFLALAEQRRGDRVAAQQDFRRALTVYERRLPPNHPYLLAARRGLAAVAP